MIPGEFSRLQEVDIYFIIITSAAFFSAFFFGIKLGRWIMRFGWAKIRKAEIPFLTKVIGSKWYVHDVWVPGEDTENLAGWVVLRLVSYNNIPRDKLVIAFAPFHPDADKLAALKRLDLITFEYLADSPERVLRLDGLLYSRLRVKEIQRWS